MDIEQIREEMHRRIEEGDEREAERAAIEEGLAEVDSGEFTCQFHSKTIPVFPEEIPK
jgi:predicted transcriptional regulator